MSHQQKSLLGHPKENILIVDDDKLILAALEELLKRSGYHIFKAYCGKDAIAILNNQAVAVIICDNEMPDTNGIEVLKIAHEIAPYTSRILLTGHYNLNTTIDAINLSHISHFITKPWEEKNLNLLVAEAVKNYQLIKENEHLHRLILSQNKELESKHNSMRQDLQLGAKIHEAMLLGKAPCKHPDFSIVALTLPSKDIDGDFFEFYHPSQNNMDIVIGDVMGKGVPAALVGTAVKTQLMRFAMPFVRPQVFDEKSLWHDDLLSPEEIVQHVHRELTPQLQELDHIVSLFYGRFDTCNRVFTYVDCGSTKPLHYHHANKKITVLKGNSNLLGSTVDEEFSSYREPFQVGDFFIFYTDGLTEAKSQNQQLFGIKRLINVVEKHSNSSLEEMTTAIKQEVAKFTNREDFEDDLTILIVKICQNDTPQPPQTKAGLFQGDLSNLKSVRDFVHKCCENGGDKALNHSANLQLAINEAFCNIVKHSYKGQAEHGVVIESKLLDDGILFQLSDKGPPFNPQDIPEPSFDGDQENGFGWHIIKVLTDHIAYVQKKSDYGWNHLRIFKRYEIEEKTMEILHLIKNNVIVITPVGDTLDAKEAPAFKEKVLEIVTVNAHFNVVMNLERIQFIDSSGLGCLLSTLRFLNQQKGELKIAQITKPIKTMFELVSLNKIFEIFPSTDEAVISFRTGQ